MNKLSDIIYKYTNITLPSQVEDIFDSSLDLMENSVLVINISCPQYTKDILNHIGNCIPLGTIFINNSESYFDIHNKSIFGEVVVTTREILDTIVNEYYCRTPSKVLGVTGSYGKTSTCTFLYELLGRMQIKSLLVGTLGVKGIDNKYLRTIRNTTPSYISLKRLLHRAAVDNIEVAVLEVSSHGIGKTMHDSRIRNIKFHGGIWTGFASDHLEYHETLDNYFATKQRFVSTLPISIVKEHINKDFSFNFTPTVIFGKYTNKICDASFEFEGVLYNKGFEVQFFQQENLVGAMILLYKLGYKNVFDYSRCNVQVPSRMECLGETYGKAPIYSDDAYRMENIKDILNYFHDKNLERFIVVMGAGGDRNRGAHYRRNIGLLASKFYKLIITDDNPRSENAIGIREEIINNNNNILNIGNRFDALIVAFNIATANNIILILSHGSDETVMYKNHYLLMSDREVFQHYKFHYMT